VVTTLSQLVNMIQEGAIPAWVRDYVVAHRDEIATELRTTGIYTLRGPNGIEVVVRAEKQAAAA
jgi:hypothetical protein